MWRSKRLRYRPPGKQKSGHKKNFAAASFFEMLDCAKKINNLHILNIIGANMKVLITLRQDSEFQKSMVSIFSINLRAICRN